MAEVRRAIAERVLSDELKTKYEEEYRKYKERFEEYCTHYVSDLLARSERLRQFTTRLSKKGRLRMASTLW